MILFNILKIVKPRMVTPEVSFIMKQFTNDTCTLRFCDLSGLCEYF